MPELPDITVYLERLEPRVLGQPLERITLAKPFVLRSVAPALSAAEGRRVVGLERVGKRIVLGLEGDLYLVIHLMIAGRLRWVDAIPPDGRKKPKAVPQGRLPSGPYSAGGRVLALATFEFPTGTLVFTEAGTARRASLYLVAGRGALQAFDRGGLDVRAIDRAAFAARLTSESHTLKRSLTDPRMFDGIGNAYSDEILHRARLSPLALSENLSVESIDRLYAATRDVLAEWTERLRKEVGDGFPEKVTAFHGEMAVHGRYKKPCAECGSPVQRIRYATNETNYCARCQTGGRLLADRALSRLLRHDWPRSIDEVD